MFHRLLFVPALAVTLLTGCIVIPLTSLGERDYRQVTVLEADRLMTTSRFLMLDVSGVITAEKGPGVFTEGTSLVEEIREMLELAREDRHIKALIVRIDSPGGDPTASDIIRGEIRRYAEDAEVPVVAVLMGTAASGGYYVASGADRIVAHPTTVTGSIGVMLLTLNVEGLEELVGVRIGSLTSGPHKDILSPFRPMTDEERAILQSVIDDLYAQFLAAVGESRSALTPGRIRELADGRIYTARQAHEAGLVDEISTLPAVIEDLREELDLPDVEVITYRRDGGGEYNIYSRGLPRPMIDVDLVSADSLMQGMRPGFYYLWIPGL